MDLNMKILVVDDFATMRRIISGSLKKIGCRNIIEAEDGVIALEILKKEDVELILCDWNMPNMNGLQLLKAVKGNDDLKDIPFIMVTAEGMKDNVLEAVKAGVNDYIIKPFTPEILSKKMKEIFK